MNELLNGNSAILNLFSNNARSLILVTDDNLTNSAVRLFSNSIEDAENEDDRVDGIECSEKLVCLI